MKVIICVDDNMGMLFHNRRQSKDRALLDDVMKNAKHVWVHSFSEKMFAEYVKQIIVDDAFLLKAGQGEVCFVENQLLTPYIDRIEQLILYHWNRKYPSDFKMDLNLADWEMTEQVEFEGNSHEKITREMYVRRV